ncbi:uncharacterized protein LOC134346012 [Mobula hypostoma]|uniref:uncharacterized protein LOC134346012 n=1 Tax=Mobula hypostoma TaxID=723540 RepID=UPI002FC3AAC4
MIRRESFEAVDRTLRDASGKNEAFSASVPSPILCYWYMNIIGNQFGNCGRKDDGSFLSCPIKDVRCGKLQCNGKGSSPAIGGRMENVVSQFSSKGKNIECYGTYFSGDAEGVDMVVDGTPCGSGKVCINKVCRNVAGFGVAKCNKYCSGHGVCNNNDACYCDPGWAPPNCTSAGQGGSMNSVTWFSQQPAKTINIKALKLNADITENNLIYSKGKPTSAANGTKAGTTTPQLPEDSVLKSGASSRKKNAKTTTASPGRGTPIWLMVLLVLVVIFLLVVFVVLLYYLRKKSDSTDDVSERSNLSENNPTVRTLAAPDGTDEHMMMMKNAGCPGRDGRAHDDDEERWLLRTGRTST